MRAAEHCTDGAPHRWSEWRYSEVAAGAVRHCAHCNVLIDRARDVIGQAADAGAAPTTTTSTASAVTSAPVTGTVLDALGGSPFAEELRGDFAQAARIAESMLAAATSPAARADALVVRGSVHILQGEILAAHRVLEEALAESNGDANIRLRALSHLLDAQHRQYNLFPDGGGVGSVQMSAWWGGTNALLPLDTQWNDAVREATGGAAQLEAWLTYAFRSQLLPSRYMLDTQRYSPSEQSLSSMLAMATSGTARLRDRGRSLPWPPFCDAADVIEADLHRRAGELPTAERLIGEAQYAARGDRAGEALVMMTRTDWISAPWSSPLSWNFALVDSSGPSSALATPLEVMESFPRVTEAERDAQRQAYESARALFAAAGARRGEAAIALRLGFLAAAANEWNDAVAYATQAHDLFAAAGDHLNARLAHTHLLMATLSGASTQIDAMALATEIGAWGAASGSVSFALGCGVLVNRLARHWLVRYGHAERALACAAAAHALFEALGASVNAAQCLVDMGLMHKAVGLRRIALTYLEQALDAYTALADSLPAVASNLRQRLVLLGADVYQLALQDTDADGMERYAARLATQLHTLPTAIDLQQAMRSMQERMAAMLAGTATADDPQDMHELMVLAPLGQLAESIVRNSAVLAPVYRSRAAARDGDVPAASAWLLQAEQALPAVREGEREMLRAVVLAERKDFAAAAVAMRAYLDAGGANAGSGREIAKVLSSMGGGQAAAELRLQERRTHEQAFSAFTMVRAYDDAAVHLAALEQMCGREWWADDGRPWQPLCDIAELHEYRGDLSSAKDCYARAVEQLEQRRVFLSRDELKVALASDKGAQYVYLLAARSAVRTGDAAAGFAFAERAKSRALLDLMAVSREPVPGAELPEMRAWREQGMQLQVTRGLLAQARSNREGDRARIVALEAQLRAGEASHRQAERALSDAYPRFQQAVSASAGILGADEVRRLLGAGTLLLEYFFVGEELLAWALTRDTLPVAHHATGDTSELARDIRALHAAIDASTAWQPVAARLAERLLAPFASLLETHTDVIVVPHGAAHLLPFHLLPVHGAPLASTHTVSYLPSASTLQWLPERSDAAVPTEILVVGNPTLDLPASVREAEFVAEQFSAATLLVEGAATEAAVRAAIPGVPLVHFATHGVLDEAMPLNSALLLADGDELTVYELMLLRLQARLVVLSACSTARGETTGGDDVLGLTRALLAAGAEAAVVSLWPVDDHSTALFMQAFYAALARGLAPRHALQAAQRSLRAMSMSEIESHRRSRSRSSGDAASAIPDDDGGYRHPYFWAPFILVGR